MCIFLDFRNYDPDPQHAPEWLGFGIVSYETSRNSLNVPILGLALPKAVPSLAVFAWKILSSFCRKCHLQLFETSCSLVVWNIFIFPIYGVSNHPNWRTHIFQRGSNHQPVIVRIFCQAKLVSDGSPFSLSALPFENSLDGNGPVEEKTGRTMQG